MSFPELHGEIRQMIRRVVLQTRHARAIARKAGLKAGAAQEKPHTAIAAYINPLEAPLVRQYIVDLTNKTEIRLSSQSNIDVYILYSTSTDSSEGPLDPNDYAPMFGATPDEAFSVKANSGEDLPWLEIFEFNRRELRLAVSTDAGFVSMNPSSLDGPFSLMLQVR